MLKKNEKIALEKAIEWNSDYINSVAKIMSKDFNLPINSKGKIIIDLIYNTVERADVLKEDARKSFEIDKEEARRKFFQDLIRDIDATEDK